MKEMLLCFPNIVVAFFSLLPKTNVIPTTCTHHKKAVGDVSCHQLDCLVELNLATLDV